MRILTALCSFLFAGFIVAGVIAAARFVLFGATLAAYILVALALVVTPVGAIFAGYVAWKRHQHAARLRELELAEAEARLERERAQTAVLRRTVAFDSLGNAALVDDYGRIVQLRGNFQPYPALTTYHAPRVERVSEVSQAEQAAAIAAPEPSLPNIEQFYSIIPFNSLHTALGIELVSGKPLLAPIRESTHFKLIGGSGQGKSCVAAAMLDIATTTNDADHLRIGLLDLEHNTSRLFEDLPHIAEIGPRRARLVGRDADEVAQKLKLLQWELSRRSELGEAYCSEREPVLLVYVEEMLALKYEVVDKKLRQEMLAAINLLGVRARKYGIFLLACMQTDYSDSNTREAMAQFRTRAGFAIDPDTARASGFFSLELVKQNFTAGRPGQFVLEKPQFSGLALAPAYDVRAKLAATARPSSHDGQTHSEAAATAYRRGAVVAPVAAVTEPLQAAHQADAGTFTAQERRIIRKFMEGMPVSHIVASEYSNSKGEPVTGGAAFKHRSQEIQHILRRALGAELESES